MKAILILLSAIFIAVGLILLLDQREYPSLPEAEPNQYHILVYRTPSGLETVASPWAPTTGIQGGKRVVLVADRHLNLVIIQPETVVSFVTIANPNLPRRGDNS